MRRIGRNKMAFSLEDVRIDLENGTLKIDGVELAQNVCLAFSVAILHVLCKPEADEGKKEAEGKQHVKHVQYYSDVVKAVKKPLALLTAAGCLQKTPCNSYLKRTAGERAQRAGRVAGGDAVT